MKFSSPLFSNLPPPPEIGLLILYESVIEDVYRNNNFNQANFLINMYVKDTVNKLMKQLSPTSRAEISKYFNNFLNSLQSKDIENIERAYKEFKNHLYLLYNNNYDIKGQAPELNFIMLDLNQLIDYSENKKFKFVISETEQLLSFINLIQNRFIEKKIFIPEVRFLYNYIIRVLNSIKAAALDKDSNSLIDRITLLRKLFDSLKYTYETKKFNWNFDR